ncbi:MAG: hypothetical protein JXQ97_02550 [Natronospirillum sp.]
MFTVALVVWFVMLFLFWVCMTVSTLNKRRVIHWASHDPAWQDELAAVAEPSRYSWVKENRARFPAAQQAQATWAARADWTNIVLILLVWVPSVFIWINR